MFVAPNTTTEQHFAEVLAAIVDAEQVSVDSNFFEDLGADSMVMARFCARVRKRSDLPSVSMKDVYKHPTIRSLVASVSDAPPATVPAPTPASPVAPPTRASKFVLCGVLQLLSLLGYFYSLAFVAVQSYGFVDTGSGLSAIYVKALLAGCVVFLAMCTLPVLLKWMLIGRWKPQEIPIWGIRYFRFWFVKTLTRLNPLALFAGSPVYIFYLRALGAKIGRDVVIFSIHAPVCTDLLTIGDRAVVRKDTYFNCYRAHDGLIQIGPVSLGKDSVVGEMSVLDIETSLGDGAQLGHSSSLHSGQSIPDGEHRYGTPARHRTDVDYRGPVSARCNILRKAAYSIAELGAAILPASLIMAAGVWLLHKLNEHDGVDTLRSGSIPDLAHFIEAVVISLVLLFGSLLLAFVTAMTVPRLLNLAIKPDKVYRLYGFRYWAHRAIERLTNVAIFNRIFGDSSFIVPYLSWLGYDLKPVVQTGSNFGVAFKHTTPYLVKIGGGTMIADGLSIINAEYSSTSFRVSQVTIGSDNFLGNQVAYSSGGKTGNNCLLATKVTVPLDGEFKENIGLLGSPSFEIPRTVLRDSRLAVTAEEQARRLKAKNRHNLATIGLFLLVNWLFTCGLIAMGAVATAVSPSVGKELAVTLGIVGAILLRIFYFALVERASTRFRALQPQHCSIYDPYFWFHERYWKMMASLNGIMIFDGTPLKGVLWRLLGVRVGRRLFDDGCFIVEPTLAAIEDDCTFNAGSVLQPHSQEDGGFKSDRIKIGSRCTLGVASLVHYGVTVGDDVQVGPHAFVMKGEEIPSHARWGENPAREILELPGPEAAIAVDASLLPAASCGATLSNATLKGGQAA
jgi:non-ribosomal peptide synthetase-like protein